jgi:uncharacterized integral membrane protein (TIGR00698 family)
LATQTPILASSLQEASPRPTTTAARPSMPRYLLDLIPGTALLFGIGLLGKALEALCTWLRESKHLPAPRMEYVLWAILIGLFVSNVMRVPRIFAAGIATYELWLKLGIVLVGAKFLFGDMLKLGGMSIGLVFIELALSLTVMTLLGRYFKLPPKLTSLLAIGSSICGVTAIMAAQGAIEPDEEDTSTAIAAILTLGAIALFAFPAIGHALGMGQQAYGIWTGLAVDNTAEATVTGALYGEHAGQFAILAKTARSCFIGFVVLGYAVYWAAQGQATRVERKGLFLWQKFPKFILGFAAISVLATAGFFTKGQLSSLSNLSKWAFLPAFAGVGLRTQLRDLLNQGWRPILVGVLGEIFIALVTLGMVYAVYHGNMR